MGVIFRYLLKNIFVKKERSQRGEDITIYERNILTKDLCPNCVQGRMVRTSSGRNVRCPKCGQGYNLSIFGATNIGIDEKCIIENTRYKLEKCKRKIN